MGTTTLIEWTDHTFNAWIGCTQISPGCANCYAKTDAPARIARSRRDNPIELWGDAGARQIAKDWSAPLTWNRKAREEGVRRRVFCLSQGDVFEDRGDLIAPRARLWELIAETPHLDWLLLTKRPENASRLASLAALHAWDGGGPDAPTWLPNIWLGTTVENQKMADERIPHLLSVPAKVRFLSCEPLLEEVDLSKWLAIRSVCTRCDEEFEGHVDECPEHGDQLLTCYPHEHPHDGADEHGIAPIQWVIIGGESGRKARPCDVTWIRDLVEQCKVAGVAAFVKQLGAHPYDGRDANGPHDGEDAPCGIVSGDGDRYWFWLEHPDSTMHKQRDRKGGDPDEWPEDLRVREFPHMEVTS